MSGVNYLGNVFLSKEARILEKQNFPVFVREAAKNLILCPVTKSGDVKAGPLKNFFEAQKKFRKKCGY